MKDKILEEAKRILKPEFVNRLDDLIVFHALGRPELLQIIDLEIKKVTDRIRQKEITITLDDGAKDFLIEKGYDPQYGARPMRRAVERHLEDPMAEEILRGNLKSGDTAQVSAENGKLVFRTPAAAEEASASAS
jgi:ATP-dependent Clp protease ATP-binding subunit ClpC